MSEEETNVGADPRLLPDERPEKRPRRPERPLPLTRLGLDQVLSAPVERFLWGHLFPRRKVSILFGPTHAGKTALAAGLVFHLAAGLESYLGMDLPDPPPAQPAREGEWQPEVGGGFRVLVYTAEDDTHDWSRKAGAQLRDWDSKFGEEKAGELMIAALSRLYIADRSGAVVRFTEVAQVREGRAGATVTRNIPLHTAEHEKLRWTVTEIRPDFILVETVSHLVDDETNTQFAALGAALTDIAQESGGALVASHHSTKAAASSGELTLEDARGGYALVANSKGSVVGLYDAPPELAKRHGGFASENLRVLKHFKGTPSTPVQPPLLLVKGGYENLGAVFHRTEDAQADPVVRAAQEAQAAEARRREDEQLAIVYDVAEALLKTGPVSKNRLRGPLREAGLLGRDTQLDAVVDKGLGRGVLKAARRGSDGRILSIDLGCRPVLTPFTANPAGSPESGLGRAEVAPPALPESRR